MTAGEPFDAALGAALLGFNNEAVLYCQGIADTSAHEYAMNYTRELQIRAKGLDPDRVRIPSGLFAPNKALIEANLNKICCKHFPT